MSDAAVHGVVVVDKPRGPTSHDVVARIRRALGTRRVGHAGTLDPMATGVLVVAVGEATKLVPYLTASDKAYEAEITIGAATDTLDAEGTTTERAAVPDAIVRWAERSPPLLPPPALLEAALAIELRRREQVPPAFSAVHVDGRRSHDLARRGEAVSLPPRPVEVRSIELLAARAEEGAVRLTVRVSVGKGYYVRSLARDLGRALESCAHLSALRRLRSGDFALDDAVSLDEPPDRLAVRLLSLTEAAKRVLPCAVLSASGLPHARAGRLLAAHDFVAAPPKLGPAAWLDEGGALVAIGEWTEAERGRVVRGFVQA